MLESRFASLFSSPIVRILDARCRCGRRPQDEEARSHSLLFTRSGLFVKRGRGGDVVAEPGQLLFFNRGESYSIRHPVGEGHDCTLLAFDASVMQAAADSGDSRAQGSLDAPFAQELSGANLYLVEWQKRLRRALLDASASTLEVEESALRILGAALRDARTERERMPAGARATTREAWRSTVEATRLRLAGDPASNVSLARLAQSVGSSPFHLARIFRRELGMSIHQYRLRIRLALALERLSEGACDLTELALELGFSSHSHLTGLFVRTFGLPPSEFRTSVSGGRLRRFRRRLA